MDPNKPNKTNAIIESHFSLCQLNLSDDLLILEIFKKSPTYFLRVDGCEPTLNTVRDAVIGVPKTRTTSYLKEFLLINLGDQPIGVVDIHINHPELGITYVGLLLIAEHLFGKGIGRQSYEIVENYIKSKFDTEFVRLGVSDDNDVSGYWKKMGFMPNGHAYSWKGENKTTNVVEFEKRLVK